MLSGTVIQPTHTASADQHIILIIFRFAALAGAGQVMSLLVGILLAAIRSTSCLPQPHAMYFVHTGGVDPTENQQYSN